MNDWYLAYTRPQKEFLAVQHLSDQGYDVYLPKLRKTRRHARKIESVLRPMFPRYLFVRPSDKANSLRSINSTIGISHMVYQGDAPASVSDIFIKEIKSREGEGGAVMLAQENLSPGSSLIVTDGAFADQIGLFEKMVDEKRVFLLLSILGRQVRVEVPVLSLARAS